MHMVYFNGFKNMIQALGCIACQAQYLVMYERFVILKRKGEREKKKSGGGGGTRARAHIVAPRTQVSLTCN